MLFYFLWTLLFASCHAAQCSIFFGQYIHPSSAHAQTPQAEISPLIYSFKEWCHKIAGVKAETLMSLPQQEVH